MSAIVAEHPAEGGGVSELPGDMKRFVDEAPERQAAIMRRWLADPRVRAILRRYDHEIREMSCRTCRFWTANRDSTEHLRVCAAEQSDRHGHWAPANHGCKAWQYAVESDAVAGRMT